jgi:hypothetical protein
MLGSIPTGVTGSSVSPIMAGGPAGTGSGVGGVFSGLFDTLTGSNLVQTGLSAAALQDQMNRLSNIGTGLATGARELGEEAQAGTAFRPFTVSTGFGGVQATPTGGYATTLDPAMAAQQRALQGITSGLLGGMGGMGAMDGQTLLPGTLTEDTMRFRADPRVGIARPPGTPEPPRMYTDQLTGKRVTQEEVDALGGMTTPQAPTSSNNGYLDFYKGAKALPAGYVPPSRGPDTSGRLDNVLAQQPPQAPTAPATGNFGAGIPDVSGIQQQALGGVGGFLTGAMAPMAQREADVYERIRATQRPEEQRAQLALEERLAAQGRTGLRTAQFGGSPEQLALAQAQEEAKARASLGALGQAQAEQLQQMGLAESMFGLGGRAAALPQGLQAGQLGNIGTAMGLQYLPEQQLLASLTPAISLADIAGTGQRQGAGYLAQAGTTGLEALGQTELARANLLRDLYSGLLAQQTNAQTGERQESIAGGLFGDLISGIGGIFGIGN